MAVSISTYLDHTCSICMEKIEANEPVKNDPLLKKIKQLSRSIFPQYFFLNKNRSKRNKFIDVANQLREISPICEHNFHTHCLNKWKITRITENHEFDCPLCRALSDESSFSSIAEQLFFQCVESNRQYKLIVNSKLFTTGQLKKNLSTRNVLKHPHQTQYLSILLQEQGLREEYHRERDNPLENYYFHPTLFRPHLFLRPVYF